MIHECILEVRGDAAHLEGCVIHVLVSPKVFQLFFSPTKCWNKTKLRCVWESPAGCVGLGIEQTFVLTREEEEVFGINLFT